MGQEEKAPERERRDWIIILIILLFGFLCVLLAGQWAIRFAPTWRLDTNMGSNIDPNRDFLTNRPEELLEPIDPAILTNAIWVNLYQTPGAVAPTSLIPSTNTAVSSPTPAQASPTPIIIGTSTHTPPVSVTPTNTILYYPPPTNTPRPPSTSTNTPLPTVDLAITKDDGNTSYVAGGTVTYMITVINNGPNNVTGAVVNDANPVQITTWTWACTAQNGGASGCDPLINSGSSFSDTVDLPSGASIVYTVTSNIAGGASGTLVNTATISVPSGYADTTPGNNSATDTDTLTTTSADLSITKDDGLTIVNNGDTVTYTVRVTNNGPDGVTGAILSDPAASGLNKTGVSCSGTPGQCVTPPSVAQLQSGTFALPALANGQFYEISITANVTATSGNVANTARTSAPAGVFDPNVGNNAATDTDAVVSDADLWIEVTDNATHYAPNALKLFPNIPPYAYTITVHNAGPSNVTGAMVSNVFSNGNASSIGWVCTPSAGSACGALLGGGALNNALVDLNSGASVTFYLSAQVIASPSGNLINAVTVTAPLGVTDTVPGNNSAADIDTLITSVVIGSTNLDPPNDGIYEGLGDGDDLTVTLSTPLSVGSHAGWDLIYYEQDAGGGIEMDWVTLQIGDGSNWYTILNWGDGAADSNTSIAIPLAGNPGGTCIGEPDNCIIDGGYLSVESGSITGIAIDVDGLGIPSGSYPYLRIIATTGGPGGDGGVDIDGIYVIP